MSTIRTAIGRIGVVAGLAGAVAAVAAGLAACGSLGSVAASAQREQARTFTVAAADRLIVRGHVGNITITGSGRQSVSVTTRLYYTTSVPAVSHQLSGGTLTLGYSCLKQASCGVAFDIAVPEAIAVQLSDDTGDVALSALAGPLAVNVGTGNVSAIGLSGANVKLATGVGDITGQFSGGTQTVSATAGTGDVHLRMPGLGPYRVITRTGQGRSSVSVHDNPGAARVITATTGIGDITVAPA